MSRKPLSAVRNIIRQLLRDEFSSTAEQDFADDEMDIHIGECLVEISERIPCDAQEPVPVTANSKLLDISGIEDLIGVDRVEYTVGQDPRNYRNFETIDHETIEMIVSSSPSESGESGTLTGTVTFTAGSATVTGSGTDFDGELAKDYYIKPSGGSRWYRVYSVESDTSLTLDEPVKSGDAGADTVSLTQYRYGVAIIHCKKVHQLTDEASTLSPQLEKLLADGASAYIASSWIHKVRDQVDEAITKIADVNTAINNMSARIDQAIVDISSERALVGENREAAKDAINEIDMRITLALADLNTGRGYINKINVGGSPQSDHGNMASRELHIASESLQKANGLLNLDAAASQNGTLAARELSVTGAHLNQASGYTRELSSRLSIAGVINSYQNWANNKLSMYRNDLRRMAPVRVKKQYSRS